MKRVLFICGVLYMGGLAMVKAQEVNLDPVTITSSLMEKRASESGRNIAVIRGEEIRDLPVHSLDEVLRYIPGVEVQARGPMGSQSDIVLRGGTFQQVLVILDGLRINDPTTGHFSSYIPISPAEIERIEVLKGASSSVYGSEAVGGVISIVTKTFGEGTKDPSPQRYLEGGGTVGANGLVSGKIGGYLTNGRFSLSGGVLSNNAEGEAQRGTTGYFHNHTASLSAGYRFSPHLRVAYRASYDHRDFAAQNFYTVFVSDTASERVTGWWNQLEVGYERGKSGIQLRGGYKRTADHYVYNPSSIPNDNTSALWQGLLTWRYAASDRTDLVSGLHYQQKSIISNDRGNHGLRQLAPFLVVSHRIGGLTVHPSLRLDWREGIGTELAPQLNLSYKLKSWQLRTSAGKTIRDADFTERFNNYNKPLVTGGSIGNPDLKAERSFSYEAGVDWFPVSSVKVSATWFQRRHSDLIDYVSTPYQDMPRKDNLVESGAYALARNIARVTTSGAEADVQYARTWTSGHRLRAGLGLTFLDSDGAGQTPSFYIASHARLLTNASFSYAYKRLQVSANGLYKVRKAREAAALETSISKSYFVCNARIGYAVVRERLSLYLQADNLTDTRYSDLLGAVMPGRWVMAGVTFRL